MYKVLLYGNLCNLGYNFAKAINEADQYSLKAELLIASHNLQTMNQSNPIWEAEELEVNLPDWIVISNENKIRGGSKLHSAVSLLHNYFNCKEMFSKRDIVISSTLMNIWAMLCSKKYVAMTTGADIIELAHEDSILAKLYVRSLKKSSCIGLLNTNHLDDVKQLGLDNYRFIPFAIDTAKYMDAETMLSKETITILHSSALDWIEAEKRPNNVKRNDVFFRGLAKFLNDVGIDVANRIKVIVMESGKDIPETKDLNIKLGIQDKIVYMPKCPKVELIEKYREADIVVDQFAAGSFGLNALEAMASGSIVMTYLKEENALMCYGDLPPMLNCKSEADVYNALMKLASNNFTSLGNMKMEARNWAVKHHDYNNVVPILTDIINSI